MRTADSAGPTPLLLMHIRMVPIYYYTGWLRVLFFVGSVPKPYPQSVLLRNEAPPLHSASLKSLPPLLDVHFILCL